MHTIPAAPDPWITAYADYIPACSEILDLACGSGRHGRLFLERGCRVSFLDRNLHGLMDLEDHSSATLIQYDLENGNPWPIQPCSYAGIIVTNYLYRPIYPHLIDALKPGGILLYKTFAIGNELFGRPKNPNYLLCENELREIFGRVLDVVDFCQRKESNPTRVTQAICAIKPVVSGDQH